MIFFLWITHLNRISSNQLTEWIGNLSPPLTSKLRTVAKCACSAYTVNTVMMHYILLQLSFIQPTLSLINYNTPCTTKR